MKARLSYKLCNVFDDNGELLDEYSFQLEYYHGECIITRLFKICGYYDYARCKYTVYWEIEDSDLDVCDYNIHDFMKQLSTAKESNKIQDFIYEQLTEVDYETNMIVFDVDIDHDHERSKIDIDAILNSAHTAEEWII